MNSPRMCGLQVIFKEVHPNLKKDEINLQLFQQPSIATLCTNSTVRHSAQASSSCWYSDRLLNNPYKFPTSNNRTLDRF
jgi:hypothetical protein